MILKFPDLETLRLALTTGAVPVAVSQAAAVAGFDEAGSVWVETAAALPRAAQNEVRRLGVVVSKTSGADITTPVSCWPEILPLQADPDPLERLDSTPILFELASGEGFAHLVAEILRLGNDRQGFRWLEEAKGDGEVRGLLRVVGPPYYSLLRAIDRHGQGPAPIAYRERAPRVWVEVGWKHPLAEHVKPAAGKLLLLRSPRVWTRIADGPFRDVYEVMEFALPGGPVDWNEGRLQAKVHVAPVLTAGGSTDGAELWVLRENPVEELNRFVQAADDQLMHRLAFAVGEKDGRTTIVLRVRPSKLPPPEVVLKAEAYKHYLKLPNLFLPVGTRLHPPLRRDMVRKLLAEDPAQVVWLARGEGGAFTPETLPDDAFRPLIDWIDYVLDREQAPLQAWVQAAQFDFEAFVCDEDQAAKPRKPPPQGDRPRSDKKKSDKDDGPIPDGPLIEYVDKSRKPGDDKEDPFEVQKIEPGEAQKQLRALEEEFLAVEGGLDAEARYALWPKLAELSAAVGGVEDAGICWGNALWQRGDVPEAWAWNWFRTEASVVPVRPEPGVPRGRSWVSRVTTAGAKGRDIQADDLDRLLKLDDPATSDLRALAAYLVWAARRDPPPGALLSRLNPAQRFLETHEKVLPVRSAWLAWLHLMHLSRGDVLALARARDRLLERLYHNGLRPEQDLPGFLRFAGQPTSKRFHDVRQWMTRLCKMAHDWVKDNGSLASGPTPMGGYVNLLFAFGMARLGEHDACRDLLNKASEEMRDEGEPHAFLLQAFAYRIRQAVEGKPHAGPLPAEQMEYLEGLGRKNDDGPNRSMERYIADRMRSLSRVLEPDQEVDPYRHWQVQNDDVGRALADLTDLADRDEIARRLRQLLRDAPKGQRANEIRAAILREALNQAPRVGEEFARELLDALPAVYDALPDGDGYDEVERKAQMLEKGLFTAGHFDRVEHIHPLTGRFQKLLQSLQGPPAVKAINVIARKCLRSLRKLGLRDEIDRLLTQMADIVLAGQEIHTLDPGRMANGPEALRALLQVAGGWYYFGRDRQADPVLNAARAMLFKEELEAKEKAPLACSYASAAGQAPVEAAQKRLEELFTRSRGIRDGFTTCNYYSRFQIEVIEAAVLAVANDDFTLGANARRWLDDDEYLVRRRIHKDVRAQMAHA